MDTQKIGSFIREERKKNKLTQKQFAELLHVSAPAVSKWEKGVNTPDMANLIGISKLLNVSASEILNGEHGDSKKIQEPVTDIEAETSASVAEMAKAAEPPPTPARPAPKDKRKIHRRIMAVSVFLLLVMGCIVLIAVHNYYAQPVFKIVDEYYGSLENMSFENVYYVVFESNQQTLNTNDYNLHFESIIANYDLAKYEECDAIYLL